MKKISKFILIILTIIFGVLFGLIYQIISIFNYKNDIEVVLGFLLATFLIGFVLCLDSLFPIKRKEKKE